MNAKIKLIAAMAALQMIVPAVFAQPRPVVVPRPTVVVPSPVGVPVFYEITGRIVDITYNSVVVRTREGRNLIFVRRDDSRISPYVKLGDWVSLKYSMVAAEVVPATPLVPPRYR